MMIEIFNGLKNKEKEEVLTGIGGGEWEFFTNHMLGINSNYVGSGGNSTTGTAYGGILPKESFYFDLEWVTYSQDNRVFLLGISNDLIDTTIGDVSDRNDVVSWFGSGYTPANSTTELSEGKYRFAFDYNTMRFYMAKLSPNQTTSVWKHAPSFTGKLRIFYQKPVNSHGAYNLHIAELGLGSGGLY